MKKTFGFAAKKNYRVWINGFIFSFVLWEIGITVM
jgi:hypothetical protein